MRYIRTVDFSTFNYDGYEFRMLFVGDTCRVIASSVAAGLEGPPMHVHKVDQMYYVVEGSMNVQLGDEVHHAPKDSAIFIPAGTPHRNWNASETENEFHFEVLAPGPNVNEAVNWVIDLDHPHAKASYAAPVNWDYDASAAERAYVRPLEGIAEALPALPGFSRRMMIGPDDCTRQENGNGNAILYVGDITPSNGGPTTHIHTDADQFYYVLEGELNVEVALDHAVVGPHTLVVLPAGVPHTLWNAGPGPERHLSLIAPVGPPGAPTDILVNFSAVDPAQDRRAGGGS